MLRAFNRRVLGEKNMHLLREINNHFKNASTKNMYCAGVGGTRRSEVFCQQWQHKHPGIKTGYVFAFFLKPTPVDRRFEPSYIVFELKKTLTKT